MAKAPKFPTPPVPTEHEEQAALFRWLAFVGATVCPEALLAFAIPNAAKRSMALAAMMKAEGMKAGVPDVCLPVPRHGRHGLYIEMKRRKGGKESDEQKYWRICLNGMGYRAVVCRGYDEARAVFSEYLGIKEV